jgi:Flp pilus assembly pilin Flp
MRFRKEEEGQDLVEYSLLLAFVVLAAAAIFATSTQNMGGIWQHDGATLNIANNVAGPN